MSKVQVLLAATPARLQVWLPALQNEALHVVSVATTAEDLQAKMAYAPQVILVEGALFPGPDPLRSFLTGLTNARVFLVLPPGTDEATRQALATIPVVHEVHVGDIQDLHTLPQRIANAVRSVTPAEWQGTGAVESVVSVTSAPTVVGFRAVGFWNHAGGVGKTTLAAAVAHAAAQRGIPTLLIGLSAPDDLPLIMGAKPEPNIAAWMAAPSVEGLQDAIQQGAVSLLAGFPDVLAEARFASLPPNAPAALPSLVATAGRAGFVLVVLDIPANSPVAAQALAAVTHLVLVSTPSLADILRTVEAYRTVTERLAGQHRLPAGHVWVALNRVGQRIPPQEWHRAAADMLRDLSGVAMPPLIATIPDSSQVAYHHDRRESPLTVSEFNTALEPLVNALAPRLNGHQAATGGQVWNIGGFLKVRVRSEQ